jgi:hypothetical protein
MMSNRAGIRQLAPVKAQVRAMVPVFIRDLRLVQNNIDETRFACLIDHSEHHLRRSKITSSFYTRAFVKAREMLEISAVC